MTGWDVIAFLACVLGVIGSMCVLAWLESAFTEKNPRRGAGQRSRKDQP